MEHRVHEAITVAILNMSAEVLIDRLSISSGDAAIALPLELPVASLKVCLTTRALYIDDIDYTTSKEYYRYADIAYVGLPVFGFRYEGDDQ